MLCINKKCFNLVIHSRLQDSLELMLSMLVFVSYCDVRIVHIVTKNYLYSSLNKVVQILMCMCEVL